MTLPRTQAEVEGIIRSLCQYLYSETFKHVVACLNETLGAVEEEKKDL
jgi:myosin heavy subunit